MKIKIKFIDGLTVESGIVGLIPKENGLMELLMHKLAVETDRKILNIRTDETKERNK